MDWNLYLLIGIFGKSSNFVVFLLHSRSLDLFSLGRFTSEKPRVSLRRQAEYFAVRHFVHYLHVQFELEIIVGIRREVFLVFTHSKYLQNMGDHVLELHI